MTSQGYEQRMSKQVQRFTATRVASLPAGRYGDPGQTGLQLEVRETRGGLVRTWNLRFKFWSESSTMALGTFPTVGLEEARRRAQRYRELAAQGIDPRRAKPNSRRRVADAVASALATLTPGDQHSVEFLCSEFLTKWVPRNLDMTKATAGEFHRGLIDREVLRVWRGRDARSITSKECRDLCEEIVQRGSPSQANKLARFLKKLFRFGMTEEIVTASPAELLSNPGGRERKRNRNLSPRELRAFVRTPQAACRTAAFTHAVMILLLTGQRRQELARSLWAWVDFNAKTWTFPDHVSKTRGHVVPLSDEAVKHFCELHKLARGSEWVLPKKSKPAEHRPPKELTKSMERCQRRFAEMGIEHCTLHDLRRTCRTGLARVGVLPHIGKLVLNHKRDDLDETYDQFEYMDQKRDALDKWAAYLTEQREQALRERPLVGRRTDCVTRDVPTPLSTAALRYVQEHAGSGQALRFGDIYDALREAGHLLNVPYETSRKKLQRALKDLCDAGKLQGLAQPRGYALEREIKAA
jgi:integrase